jgi:hypothetical protein
LADAVARFVAAQGLTGIDSVGCSIAARLARLPHARLAGFHPCGRLPRWHRPQEAIACILRAPDEAIANFRTLLTRKSQCPTLLPMPAPLPLLAFAPAAPEPAIAAAAARTERCLDRLERLADKALALAEAVTEDGSKESADAFAKHSRAVRLTIALIMKIQEGPPARSAKAEAASPANHPANHPAAVPPDAYAPLRTGKTAEVRELLRDVIDRETPDPKDNDALVDALDERLLCDEAYFHIADLPLRDIVERLCADLQLNPDWSRWTGEGWKPDPPFHRRLCSAFRTPSRRPIFTDLLDPDLLDPDLLE